MITLSVCCLNWGPIITGPRQPSSGAIAAGGTSASRAGPGQRLAWLAQDAVLIACDWLAGLTDWAGSRALAANTLAGASLLLALCGSAWFSGGTSSIGGAWGGRPPGPGPDIIGGVAATCGWLLARAVALGLATPPADVTGREFARLFAICSVVGECAIYGGMAAGGRAGGPIGMWPLAVTTIVSVALTQMLIACGGAAADGGAARAIAGNSVAWRWIGRILPPQAGLRVAVAVVALLIGGPWVALACVLAVEVASIGVAGWRLGKFARELSALRSPPGVLEARLVARSKLVMACRDDGALARWAGRLVRGNIIPLPPICAGVGAVALLAVLGLGGLPAIVAPAPVMALLVAAPGSAHPHDGPADWLAPVLLALGQYTYLAALGFGRQVPGPIVFALCAATATWYASLAAAPVAGRPDKVRPAGGLGWESRMLAVTFAAMVGFASVGYLAMSVYLGVLICRRVGFGYPAPVWAAT